MIQKEQPTIPCNREGVQAHCRMETQLSLVQMFARIKYWSRVWSSAPGDASLPNDYLLSSPHCADMLRKGLWVHSILKVFSSTTWMPRPHSESHLQASNHPQAAHAPPPCIPKRILMKSTRETKGNALLCPVVSGACQNKSLFRTKANYSFGGCCLRKGCGLWLASISPDPSLSQIKSPWPGSKSTFKEDTKSSGAVPVLSFDFTDNQFGAQNLV